MAAVELRRIALERYKGYARRVELELAPLTILVGPNNSGKTALAQAIQLLAGGLVASDREAREPLPLVSGGIRHGETFEDLVTGRALHGRLHSSVTLVGERGELSLFATVTNVVAPGRPSERQVSDWRMKSDHGEIHVERQGFGGSSNYRVSVSGTRPRVHTLAWRGLIPRIPGPPDEPAKWADPQVDALKTWAAGVRHLRCPRRLVSSPFLATERSPAGIEPDGRDAPLALAADDALRDSVRRPLVVETHSEMVLLRARRWVAEGRLPSRHVLVYWIHAEPGHGSVAEKISIRENGEMDTWPDGVFIEDYEEILAIRRAARRQGPERHANRD